MKLSLLPLLLPGCLSAALLAAGSASAQSSVYYRPDSALTRQAFQLSHHFTRTRWTMLAAGLYAKPHPVLSYIDYGQHYQRRPPRATGYPTLGHDQLFFAHYRPSWPTASPGAFRRLDNHLTGLRLERRLADYQRLGEVLLTRATKVRKIKDALPLLVLRVDSAGRVLDVLTDRRRTRYGITARSRKLILKALRDDDFRVREAYDYFEQPRPLHEKWLITRRRVSNASAAVGHFLFDWALYHKVKRRGRCGEVFYTRELWFSGK